MRHWLQAAMVLGLITTLVISGCASPPQTTAPTSSPITTTSTAGPTTTPPATLPKGPYGDLRVGVSSFGMEKWDPVTATETTQSMLISPMSDFLMRIKGRVIGPGLVEKWELADGPSMIFTLAKGITWHNGDPLTAKDIKYTFERTIAEGYYSNIRDTITGQMELIDDYTIKVYTKGPRPYFPTFLSDAMGSYGFVIPKDYIEKNGLEYFERHPIGNGPFKYVRNVPGDMVEYEGLDKHYRQVPAFKKLLIMLIPEETTRLAMLKTGQLDIVEVGIEGASEAEGAGMKSAQLILNTDNVLFHGTYAAGAKLPTGNIKVRQALSLAINREEISKTIMYGKSGPPAPGFNTFNAVDIDVDYWKDYCQKNFRYDPEAAKKLLAEAGYPNGFDIKIYAFTMGGAPYLPDLAEVIQGYWRKIGVNASLVPAEWGIVSRMRTGGTNKEPVAELVGNASVAGGSESLVPAHKMTTVWKWKGSWNLLSNAFPELDKLIDDSQSELDDTKRMEIVKKALIMGQETMVNVPLGTSPGLAAYGPRVEIEFPPLTRAIPMHVDIAKHGSQR